jgi:hypothetical protein
MDYFNKLGIFYRSPAKRELKLKHTFMQQHSDMNSVDTCPRVIRDRLQLHKTIVTVTHPHRCWVSWATREREFDKNVEAWQALFNWLPTLNKYYVFDINVRKEERFEHLYGAIKFLGLECEMYEDLTHEYVEAWPESYPQDSQLKAAYLESNELPDGHDYTKLQFAVDWYESLPTNNY